MKIEYSGVQEAIKKLQEVRKNASFDTSKMQNILLRLAGEGYQVARAGFNQAAYPGDTNVVMQIVWVSNNEVHLVATGDSVMFIEFGSGMSYPEHPWQQSYPGVVAHGEYGRGQGKNESGWIYHGEKGTGGYAIPVVEHRKNGTDVVRENTYRTWGSPPARVMYDATNHMKQKVEEILKEAMEE